MDVTVAVGTFGDPEWTELAWTRAIPSTVNQAPFVHCHRETLAEARNAALEEVTTEFVAFLDADDELEPGYIDALAAGSCDMRAPAVRYIRGRREHAPHVPRVPGHDHDCTGECLPQGNWMVIGTAVRTDLARQVGGFRDEALYEDWSLFLRCWLAGGTAEAIPAAVYRAHVRPGSRNRAPSREVKEHWHRTIYASCFPEATAA